MAFALFSRFGDDFFERSIRPFLGFISLSFFGCFKEAFVLRRIVGLWCLFVRHSSAIPLHFSRPSWVMATTRKPNIMKPMIAALIHSNICAARDTGFIASAK